MSEYSLLSFVPTRRRDRFSSKDSPIDYKRRSFTIVDIFTTDATD